MQCFLGHATRLTSVGLQTAECGRVFHHEGAVPGRRIRRFPRPSSLDCLQPFLRSQNVQERFNDMARWSALHIAFGQSRARCN
eukprot:2591753-Pleurochrysis_carterae.AAC.2